MKCLLIMAFIFINGMDTAEQRSRQPSTFRDDDLDGKAKAWLLMVESGKADEESHTRKITPKSIFIAPLLTSRSNKCKEGYRHDHLGQCVKVIKLDQRTQLELLLKRLSAMYGEEGKDEDEEPPPPPLLPPPQASSGPLHFSLPISGDLPTASTDTEDEEKIGLGSEGSGVTEEVASSGSGPTEGSGTDEPTDAAVTLISDELDYTDPPMTESTTSTTDTPTTTTTDVPYTTTTETYDESTTINTSPPVPSPPATTTTTTTLRTTTTTTTRRPTTTTSRRPVPITTTTTEIPRRNSNRIVFPDSRYEVNRRNEPVWSNYRYDVRKLPNQQLWWLPPNWRIDEDEEDAPKPAVYKFWSHLPLVHDPSFERYDRLRPANDFVYRTTSTMRPYTPHQHRHHSTMHRQGRIYTTVRPYTEIIHQQPRRAYQLER